MTHFTEERISMTHFTEERISMTQLDRASLEARLVAAERVCAMFGWCASRSTESDRDKAAHILWTRWLDAGGNSARDAWPDLNDKAVAELAQIHDDLREHTLARHVTAQS